jgi:8-oxo-dGTP diphosphatase
MAFSSEKCPRCGHEWQRRNPLPTVDMLIDMGERGSPRLVLVRRKNPPHGWSLPGGFVDYGETVEEAAVREAYEETGLKIDIVRQFHVYSKPDRDPRGHMMSTVFVAEATGEPKGGDDAREARAFSPGDFPEDIVFDHRGIIGDYLEGRY